MLEKLSSDSICPCGSSRAYGECCWDKSFDWMISADGEISRRIPVPAEIEGVLEELDEIFSAIFGRRHLPADPVFPLKYLYSERDLERETIDVMRRAGARPELVYAYRKTGGLLVTEANVDELPTQDRADWENAIDEYFETGGQEPVSEQDAAWIDLADELKNLIIVFGYLLEYGISESYQPNSELCGLLSYEFLSEFNHPGFPLSQLQASDDALDPVSTELHHESLLYSVFFAALLLDQLRLLPMLTDQMTDDLAVVVCRIRDKQLKIIDNFIDSERSEGAINLIGTRLRCISDPRA